KQKKLIMLPSETMIWQPEFTDKTLSRKPGAVHSHFSLAFVKVPAQDIGRRSLIWWTPLCRMLQIMTRWISLDAYDYMHHIVNDYATECMTHIKALGSGLITMSC
ncbi:hypothetical protein, partial [Escherichia coli]